MTEALLEPRQKSQAPVASPDSAGAEAWNWLATFGLVLLALAVRLAFLFLARTYRFGRADDFCINGEMTNVAASIVRGHGFSSPFNDVYTGPTSWLAPGYPYFVALAFWIFGVSTRASIIFMFGAQSLFSALTVVPILGIANHTVGRRAGLWAAWIWAVFPWFSKWSVTWLWDTSLSALLLCLLFWCALCLPQAPSRKAWAGFGALFGLALLVNPALGSFLPVSLGWCCSEMHRCKRKWLRPALLSVLACVAMISPWLVRNRAVFGQWAFLRSNFGFEFALGNYHASLGRGWGGSHPSGNQKEFQKYREMGEMAYIRLRQGQALEFVSEYPREFVALTAKRVLYFWDGSAMQYLTAISWFWVPSSFVALSLLLLPAMLIAHRRNLYGWQMFFGILLLYPVPYYLTYSQVRYRHPIEPLLLLLIAFAGVQTARELASFLRPVGSD